ncbi:MAG: hypothetical protein MJH10_13170 [Epibacterium sp.]|nr:hypothetical protein [Epibacterium sp.]NQX74491.1 hypothetical protein [Epibacterium sp.]
MGTDSLDVVATTATGKDTTINVSGVTGAETVNITGSDGKNTITGTAGVDTITGAEGLDTIAGGAGQDNFVIASSADAGAGEKYTDFVAGAAGDVFNFTKATIVNGAATTSDGATALAVDTTGGGTTDTDNTDVLLFTGASYADTTALLAAANGANGVGEGSDGDLDGNSVIAVFHDDTGTDAGTYVAYLTGAADHSADGFASATIIAQLSSLDELSDIADITADNFTIA